MTEKNPWSIKKIREPEHPKIMSKPLPQILDEIDDNIRAAAEAARKSEEAARAAKQAAADAHKASLDTEKRAEEARQAGQLAAEKATRAATEAVAEHVAQKADIAGIETKKLVKLFQQEVETSIKTITETAIIKRIKPIENRLKDIEEILHNEEKIYSATIYELNNPKYSITLPIQIVIIENKDEIIARIPELNIYATADTDTEAILDLKKELIELYEDLNNTDYKLGPLPKSWLITLNKLIVKTNG